jgi:antibiotic biosynthesis monooxygenase (ABM) superfamily enzyme
MQTPAQPLDEQVPVTVVVTRHIKPGREREFEAWLDTIINEAAKLEGHLGATVIRPKDKRNPEYVTILKFDHYSNLKRWMGSAVRERMLREAKEFATDDPDIQILTGLESWFTLPGSQTPLSPPRHKIVILTTAALFMLVNGMAYAASPVMGGLHPLLRSALLTPLICILMTYLVMPNLTRLFSHWLFAPRG